MRLYWHQPDPTPRPFAVVMPNGQTCGHFATEREAKVWLARFRRSFKAGRTDYDPTDYRIEYHSLQEQKP